MIPDYAMQTTIPRILDGEEVEVEVDIEVEFQAGYYAPARLHGHPDSWAPEEGESPEILSVKILEGGQDILSTLSREDLDRLIDRCWKHQQEMSHDSMDYIYYDDEPVDVCDQYYDPY